MAKKNTAAPVDPVAGAVLAMRAILDALSPEDKKLAQRRIFMIRGYFDEMRERLQKLIGDNVDMTWKLKGRKIQPPSELAKKIALAEEKKTKTWPELFAAHPDVEPETLRSRVRRIKNGKKNR
jgi:hypothetical protein